MNELALFAGAGGGILAGQLAGWKTICAVESEKYPIAVLCQRQNDGLLPAFPIWDDVQTFDTTPWKGAIDVISGGFPCQAFSKASRGRVTAQNLWPEMLRIISEIHPHFVFAENVSKEAINTAAFDLQQLGYQTKAIALSARDLGADHVRKRFWLLAYTDNKSKLLCGLNAKMELRKIISHRVWKSSPMEPRMADGMAHRMDRFKATGNGQIPIVAFAALLILCE